MDETPSGRGAFIDGLWKSVAILLFSFMISAAFMGLPAAAKLTGEYALRIELRAAQREITRLRKEHDEFVRGARLKLDKIDKIANDLDWMVKWVQAAGRK